MKLKILVDAIKPYIGSSPILIGDEEIDGISVHTDEAAQNHLFVCMPSLSRDTHQFISEIFKKGVRCVIVHSKEGLEIAQSLGMNALLIEGTRSKFIEALSYICRTFFGDPTKDIRIVGITGTNGKTTTAWILKQALHNLGRRTAYMGTLGNYFEDLIEDSHHTTPFPTEMWRFLATIKEKGCQDVVMETTSQGLVEKRLSGIRYDGALFTNLTQDHLDFHGTMQAYEQSKKTLFTEYLPQSEKPSFIGINSDDPYGRKWIQEFKQKAIPVTTYGVEGDVSYEVIKVDLHQIILKVFYKGETKEAVIGIGGYFNVINSIGVLNCLLGLGYKLQESIDSLKNIFPVPGRFDVVPTQLKIGVIVDYAHTPDALEKLLTSAQKLKKGKLITVFGCGGDRDKTKRPLMGQIASKYSDITVVTSDNPRTEDPLAIINQILNGVDGHYECYIDRCKAIQRAVEIAQPEDLVVIAGKGHENYQIIGRNKYPMDDKLMAQQFLKEREKEQCI